MFAGETINNTEQRAVLHVLLRNPAPAQAVLGQGAPESIANKLAQVHETLDAMLAYAEQVRADAAITDIVNIGIGGSDLGPQMAVLALDEFATTGKRVHFVSNVDGSETGRRAQGAQAAEHAVPDRVQNLHHHRDHDQRAFGAPLV
jgi:glucose-6-phosphate isomerase